ncbi:M61 family metallopeptidase [Adhaeribacter aquaticus]|uniref:M61 family metallopeptidase n=1 Tax=Adhaeribacter aquaticus TaxID=299567 RepID=UPI00041D1751|nr:PDZ domain-containing protein [Adhaeribacter aquaticus]
MVKNSFSKFFFSCFLFFLFLVFGASAAPKLTYTVSMTEPQTHFFEVEMTLTDLKQRYVDLKMATWTPGSYLIREYARHVEAFSASTGNQNLRAEKINKNTWRVYANNAKEVKVKYKVYAFELTVRTNFLDQSHGYINGAALFLYPDKKLDLASTITIKPYSQWKEISTGLQSVGGNKWVLQAPNFDILADSPIEIGNQEIFTFQAAGVPHTVAIYGQPLYNQERLKTDMAKIVEASTAVTGENPNRNYTFIVHCGPGLGGGLEHLNSTTVQTSLFFGTNERAYKNFLGLVAHEYFHLWNVKRIRPIALGPFDYENENYTHMLWVSEGITSYYEDVLLRRKAIYTPEEYLATAASNINTIENIPGNKVQSATESSFDAWIKNYRPNENSVNSTVSYYSRGSVIGNLLDLEIMGATKGQKTLDDVFRYLWEEYYKKKKRGYTDDEFKAAVERVAGHNLDAFFRDYIAGTQTFDYNKFFGYAGLKLVNQNEGKTEAFLGANTSATSGKLLVTSVLRDSPAWKNGINVNDEIIAVNGFKIGNDLAAYLQMYRPNDKVKVTVARAGRLLDLDVTLANNPTVNYKLEKLPNQTPEQLAVYTKWLRTL